MTEVPNIQKVRGVTIEAGVQQEAAAAAAREKERKEYHEQLADFKQQHTPRLLREIRRQIKQAAHQGKFVAMYQWSTNDNRFLIPTLHGIVDELEGKNYEVEWRQSDDSRIVGEGFSEPASRWWGTIEIAWEPPV